MLTATSSQDLVLESPAPAGNGAARCLRACPVCESVLREYALISSKTLKEAFYTPVVRDLVPSLHYGRCKRCGSLWATDGRRDAELLSRVYAQLPRDYWITRCDRTREYRQIDQLLDRFAAGDVLYDIGCGDGQLLRRLSDRWRKHGIEPGREAVGICRESGLDVVAGSPTGLQLEEVCDVVTCVDVLEHMLDPQAEVAAMARILRPDGILLILTGNPACWTARLAGGWWAYLHCVGHVSILSRTGLVRTLNNAGLEVIHQSTVSHAASIPLRPWLWQWVRNHWRCARGYRYRRMEYCRDHQLVIAKKAPRQMKRNRRCES